jgi:hypothetical protein
MKLRTAVTLFLDLRMKAQTLVPLAIAFTGLASVSHAQNTTVTAADTGYAEYHDSPISLPLGIGLRIPTYDRVNGLALPWGPKIEFDDARIDIDALVTYRSNLGKWDPSLEGTLRPGDENELKFYVGRGTFTNDLWIRGDLTNSAAAFFAGSDSRNYYRGDRASARLAHTFTGNGFTIAPFIGGNFERDWSTGSRAPIKSPWSVFGRKGILKMRRPNPRVATGHISSAIGGTSIEVVRGGLEGKFDAMLEHSLSTSLNQDCSGGNNGGTCFPPRPPRGSFNQTTLDGRVTFPTFGTQTFAFKGHAVVSGGGSGAPAPTQRFAYLGGASTLATVDLLALGGDHLLFVQGDYTIPIDRIQLPFVGTPFIGLRYAAGSAGLGGLPTIIQNLGVGVGASFFRADYTIDPAQNRSPFSRKSAFTVGLSLSL